MHIFLFAAQIGRGNRFNQKFAVRHGSRNLGFLPSS
jgi:hypothetical protein